MRFGGKCESDGSERKGTTGAILLAGGRSRRMGRDKAGLPVGGRTLLERTIALLNPLVVHTVVMLAENRDISYLPKDMLRSVTVGRDKRAEQGPLQGIGDGVVLLERAITEVFVLSCDLPYLNSVWLGKMRDRLRQGADIVCSVNGTIANPLIAIYKRSVLERAGQLIGQGYRRPLELWRGFRVEHLVPTEEERRLVTDINTLQEYQAAVEYFADG